MGDWTYKSKNEVLYNIDGGEVVTSWPTRSVALGH
jgi:hypothetical protein